MNVPGVRLISILLLGTLALGWLALPVQGSVPPQQGTPHPTLPPTAGPPGTPGVPGPAGEGGSVSDHCAGLRGAVVNWGYQNEPGVTLRLGDGGWEVAQITSTDGRYGFGSLGDGVAFLKTELTADQAKTLHPMVGDVAIRLRCDFDMIANLGLYSGPKRPALPATLTMRVSASVLAPGKTATFYLKLKNSMPNPISRVFVTDYLPDGLKVTAATATRGSVEVLNGQMVTVNVGDLPQGGEETVQIAVQADRALANGARLKNTASLLYAESVADQAAVTLVVGRGESAPAAQATTPPPTATPSPSPARTSVAGAAASTPTATPSPSPTRTSTPTAAAPTPTATRTLAPGAATSTPTATSSPSPTRTSTPTAVAPTPTATRTPAPDAAALPTPTATLSPSPTRTPAPSPTATPSPSPTPALTPAANKTPTSTPSGKLLPTTGQSVPPVWPAVVFVVALLALGVYNLRRQPPAG